jgi:hypothetical protein
VVDQRPPTPAASAAGGLTDTPNLTPLEDPTMPTHPVPAELQATRDVLTAVDLLLAKNPDHGDLSAHLARVQATGQLWLFTEAAVQLLRDVLVLAANGRVGAREVVADMIADLQAEDDQPDPWSAA